MQIDATHNAQIGFTIFDSWLKAVEKRLHSTPGGIASPMLDAAFQAFNAYASTVENMNSAQIAGVSAQLSGGYAPNNSGGCSPTNTNIAPFLALNLMA